MQYHIIYIQSIHIGRDPHPWLHVTSHQIRSMSMAQAAITHLGCLRSHVLEESHGLGRKKSRRGMLCRAGQDGAMQDRMVQGRTGHCKAGSDCGRQDRMVRGRARQWEVGQDGARQDRTGFAQWQASCSGAEASSTGRCEATARGVLGGCGGGQGA